MGLLSEGKPMHFEDAKQFLNYIRMHGIMQFLSNENDRTLR